MVCPALQMVLGRTSGLPGIATFRGAKLGRLRTEVVRTDRSGPLRARLGRFPAIGARGVFRPARRRRDEWRSPPGWKTGSSSRGPSSLPGWRRRTAVAARHPTRRALERGRGPWRREDAWLRPRLARPRADTRE